MLRSPWHGARPQRPYPATQRFWFLGRHGYETAVKSKNGFVCAVERGWMGPFDGGADNFWNPKIRGPVCYSLPAAKDQYYLTDDDDHHWVDHLMFYTPLMDGAVWGADLPKSPVMRKPQFSGAPEPFMVPTRRWSDGTAASVM